VGLAAQGARRATRTGTGPGPGPGLGSRSRRGRRTAFLPPAGARTAPSCDFSGGLKHAASATAVLEQTQEVCITLGVPALS
jgi:hypothetical protein